MANIGKVTLNIKPTVTLESAIACVYMLNLFLEDNDEFKMNRCDDGKWEIVKEAPAVRVEHVHAVDGVWHR